MPKTLKELNWFSFPDGFEDLADFTIWQAIAYILKTASKDGNAFEKYTDTLGTLEFDMAIDLLDYYKESDDPLMVRSDTDYVPIKHDDFVNPQYELDNIALSKADIEKDLPLLNQNRFTFTESMVLPNILCNLLLLELENSITSPLKFKDSQKGFDINSTRITKASLKKWKTISSIEALGLTSISESPTRRKLRSDASENQLLVLGVLIHLLPNLEPKDYMLGLKGGNPRVNIYSLAKRLLASIGEGPNFPEISAIQSIFRRANQLTADEVKFKLPPQRMAPPNRQTPK